MQPTQPSEITDKLREHRKADRSSSVILEPNLQEALTLIMLPTTLSDYSNAGHKCLGSIVRQAFAIAALVLVAIALAILQPTPSVFASSPTSDPVDRGNLQLERGEFAAAYDSFSAAIAANPERASIYALRAYASQQLGHLQAAVDDYTSLLERDPDSATTYVDRALLEGMLHQSESALSDANRAIALEPSNPRAFNARALIRCRIGDTTGGQQDFRQAAVLSLERGDRILYNIARQSARTLCLQ